MAEGLHARFFGGYKNVLTLMVVMRADWLCLKWLRLSSQDSKAGGLP